MVALLRHDDVLMLQGELEVRVVGEGFRLRKQSEDLHEEGRGQGRDFDEEPPAPPESRELSQGTVLTRSVDLDVQRNASPLSGRLAKCKAIRVADCIIRLRDGA